MIPNHAQFLSAIRERKLIRIVYYSQLDGGTVDRECVPLDYGPELGATDSLHRYWIWDAGASAGTNPLGLVAEQIVNVHVLGKEFDPAQLGVSPRPWFVLRDWGVPAEPPAAATPAAS